MTKTKVKLNYSGFYRLRISPEMRSALAAEASKIQTRAGEGFKTNVTAGAKTAAARVYAGDLKAKRAEAKTGALSKAIGGGTP